MSHQAVVFGDPSELADVGRPSGQRFPDGSAFRFEIPSVEGPEALAAVLEEAERREVRLHRVSQGSGVAMLTDDEITEMAALAAAARVELCLFLGPRANWDIGGGAFAANGIGSRVRGREQLAFSVADAERAVALGVLSLLVADEGVLWTLHQQRSAGALPADLRLKMSALSGPGNPAAFGVIERLGADSINVPSDLTIDQLAELRVAGTAAIDFYVEAPDNLGGFVRHHEIPAIVGAAAPVYLKFGLRNAPNIYPSGEHLRAAAVDSARERVRRAALGRDLLVRRGLLDAMSPPGSHELSTPVRFPASAGPVAVAVAG